MELKTLSMANSRVVARPQMETPMLAEARALDDEQQISQLKDSWGSGRQLALPKLQELHEPWARQPEETSKAFAAFCAYRDLGPTTATLAPRRSSP